MAAFALEVNKNVAPAFVLLLPHKDSWRKVFHFQRTYRKLWELRGWEWGWGRGSAYIIEYRNQTIQGSRRLFVQHIICFSFRSALPCNDMEIIIDFNLYIFELRTPHTLPHPAPTCTHFPAQIAINTYAKVVHTHTHTHRLTHIVLYYPLKLNRCWRLRAYISVILKLFQPPFLLLLLLLLLLPAVRAVIFHI